MRAFLHESGAGPVLVVEPDDAARVLHVLTSGEVVRRYVIPEDATELGTPDECRAAVLAEVAAALATVKMSKAARTAVDAALVDLAAD